MPYQQITLEERSEISRLRGLRYSVAAIAQCLGRHRSSIYRELARIGASAINTSGTMRTAWPALDGAIRAGITG